MKQDRGHDEAASTGATESTTAAPGKRSMTTGLPAPVQRSSSSSAPAPLSMDAPDPSTQVDPFGVHLDTPVQRRGDGDGGGDVHAAAARGLEAPAQRLPFLDQIQRSFGADHDVSGVQAHVGGAAAEASASMGASAYATGNHVAFGGSPDLHTAAHEAAHVVQQAHGVNLYGGVGEVGDSYEQNADAVADRVVAGASASDLLPAAAGGGASKGVQTKGAREKKHGKGFSKYGGGSVKGFLTNLVEQGKLGISGKDIAILDAVAQVETGGQIACVQTYDDQIVSIGFKQVVLGHGSLAKMMKKASGAFAKHGLVLDTSRKYQHPGWSNPPPAIQGVEDEEELRGHEWGMKFYEASMEPEVVEAMCELALGELGKVNGMVKKATGGGGGGNDYFADTTSQGWLLETYNNRPAFTSKAINRAVDNGAKGASTRDAFLDILSKSIIQTYEIEEPLLHYKKAKARKGGKLSTDEDAALLAKSKEDYTSVGHRKGNNIVTKISRKLSEPKVNGAPKKNEAEQSEQTESVAPVQKPAEEVLMSLPAPEPENMSLPEAQTQSVPETANVLPPPVSEPEPNQSVVAPIAQTAIEPTPAPAPSIEVSPPPAPAPDAPTIAPKQESAWVTRAREYHRNNSEYVDQFKAATGGACVGADGDLDPNEIARWQASHGVRPDGFCGPLTVHAAVGNEPPPIAQQQVADAPPPPAPPVNITPSVVTPTTNVTPSVTPAVPPTPAVTPTPNAAPQVDVEPKPKSEVAPQPLVKGAPTRMVVKGGVQSCLVFVSPGQLTATPDLFLFFHGYQADYGKDVDKKQDRPDKMTLYKSGSDVAEEAMAYTAGKNMIAILPQGNIGRQDERGGHMKALEGGLEPFVNSVLANVAKELKVEKLTPNHIGIAGHSAGGYEGVHQAMSSPKAMGSLADKITDVTLMDSSYVGTHFADARDWIFTGSPGKNLRIIGQKVQMADRRKGGHHHYFDHDKLAPYAKKGGFELVELPVGDKRESSTVLQHTQIVKDGTVHGDILILLSKREGGKGHHDIRDDVMDDAILSIGEGAAGNAHFDRALGEAIVEDHVDMQKGQPQPTAPQDAPQQQVPQQQQQEHVGGDDAAKNQQQDAPAPSGDDAPSNANPVPTTVHVDGADDGSKEPVIPAPIPAPPPAPAPVEPANVKMPSGSKLKEHLYGKDGKGGIIGVDKLHRDSVNKVKGKDIPIHLSDEQWKFKQEVYAACVNHLGDQIYGGVAEKDLGDYAKGKMRKPAIPKLQAMIAGLRSAPGKPADENISAGSLYRSPEVDFHLWDMGFNNIYLWDAIKWAKKHSPDDPWGAKVIKNTVHQIGERKAAPGGSKHSNGTAVDLILTSDGHTHGNKFKDQAAWKKSWAYKWLLDHCGDYGFKNYSGECWHYTYTGPL